MLFRSGGAACVGGFAGCGGRQDKGFGSFGGIAAQMTEKLSRKGTIELDELSRCMGSLVYGVSS